MLLLATAYAPRCYVPARGRLRQDNTTCHPLKKLPSGANDGFPLKPENPKNLPKFWGFAWTLFHASALVPPIAPCNMPPVQKLPSGAGDSFPLEPEAPRGSHKFGHVQRQQRRATCRSPKSYHSCPYWRENPEKRQRIRVLPGRHRAPLVQQTASPEEPR